MVRHGRWWRGVLAVTLLVGGLLLWQGTEEEKEPTLKPSLQGLPAALAPEASGASDGPELALARAAEPLTPTAAAELPRPKPVGVTDFFAERAPEPLGTANERLKRGARLSASDVKALMAYDEANPHDPRVQLLFAYDSMRLEWKRAAIGHYLQAYRMEPQAREDTSMLSDLIQLAGDAKEGALAGDAIEEIFGIDALPGVEDAITDAEAESKVELAERLAALRDRLRP
jgi:hypothetical protein